MGNWTDDGHAARRIVRKFAWLPVRTLDEGWIVGREYWLHEKIWGWGFHDKFAYANAPAPNSHKE